MTESTDTESTDEDAPVKKPRRRTSTRRKKEADDEPVSEEFGDGVDNENEETEKRPARRRRATKRKAEPKPEEAEAPREFASSDDYFDFDDEPGDYDEAPRSSDEAPRPSDENRGDDDDRPRRRRRRRRRPAENTNDRNDGGSRNEGGGRGRRGTAPRGGDRNTSRGRRGGSNNSGGGSRNQDNRRGGRNQRRDTGPRRARQVRSTTEVVEGTFEGILELHPKGYGFLRDPKKNYAAEDSNPFVSSSVVEKFGLRPGVMIVGEVGQGSRGQGPRLREITTVDGYAPEDYAEEVKNFEDLTPINPFEQIRLETGARPLTMRVMDLLCPIGKGQRALLVAPPRTGKTMLLQDIANAVSENHPEIHLIVLLIDERPEEVTEMQRMVNGEVVASSLDQDVESHIRISQLIVERGKRLAEEGKDVFILLDSITRLARAFNKWSNTGRTQTGGLDIRALDIPKKLFGTARRFDEGGSLTVCGTALIETNNKMDDAIFQEFKGTGNMEMVLSRDLADRRIWPAIDISRSGTRREEKILSPEVLDGTTLLRRSLISLNAVEAMEHLTRTMEKFPSNEEFLHRIKAVL